MSKPGPLCEKCPLKDKPGPVWGVGPSSAKLAAIGMGPASDEIRENLPFVGPAGVTLNTGLTEAGLSRESLFITNLVKCQTEPGKPLPAKAIECCAPLLEKELETLRYCKTYLTLGSEPFYAFTRKTLHIWTDGKGKYKKDPNFWLRGMPYITSYLNKQAILPTMHPVYLNYTGFADRLLFLADLKKAKRFAEGSAQFIEPHFNYKPTNQEVEEYAKECLSLQDIGLDIETPEKAATDEEELVGSGAGKIDVIGLSARIGESIGVQPDQFELLAGLLSRRSVRLFVFNGLFDLYHLRTHFEIKAQSIDVMLALHELHSDFKAKNLAVALSLYTDLPFTKNLAKTQPDLYNCVDTFGALWAGLNMLEEMKQLGILSHFLNFTNAVLPVCEALRLKGPKADIKQAQKYLLLCGKAYEQYEDYWTKILPSVSQTSPVQLRALFKSQNYTLRWKMTKDRETGKRRRTETVDEKSLESLSKQGSQLANLVLLMRKLKKASDFTELYQQDGFIHATYGVHFQKQGRIQTRNPDLQNVPEALVPMGKSEDGSTKYLVYPRNIIVGDTPEHDIIVADFAQIELRLYAKQANEHALLDEIAKGTYIYGVCYEAIYHRSFFASVPPGEPKSKKYMAPYVTPKELLVAKTGPLGWIYGRQDYTETGMTKEESNAFGRLMHSTYPAIAEFQRKLDFQARRMGYLINPFGRLRRVPNPQVIRNEYLSFMGQGTAVDVLIKNALLPIHEALPDFGARLIFTVYDSIGINCPRQHTPAVCELVSKYMQSPLEELDGFIIPCEIKSGASWGEGRTFTREASLLTRGD